MANEIDPASTDASGNPLPSSASPSISVDGTVVAFESEAPSGYDGSEDIWAKNLTTGDLTRVSAASDGTPFVGSDLSPSLSADGGTVAFNSDGVTTYSGNGRGPLETYAKDLATGELTLVSQTADGVAADKRGETTAVSAHGRLVAFDSAADNLVAGVPVHSGSGALLAYMHVYRKNVQTGALRLVATNADGEPENGFSQLGSMSAGGRFVAFSSTATNLVPGATGGALELYVKDMRTGAVTLASQTAAGTVADGASNPGSLSGDGTEVAFSSTATNLGVNGPLHDDIYVKNLVTGDLMLASSAADGTPANGGSGAPNLSPDGRYVMFDSTATNLVSGGAPTGTRVYVKDLQTGAITLLSQDADGNPVNGFSVTSGGHLFSSDDARTVFATTGSTLTGQAQNVQAIVADTQTPPDLALDPVAGNDHVGSRKAARPVLVSGTSSEVGQQVSVALDDPGDVLGTATVRDDGTWRLRVSLDGTDPGGHTMLASVSSTPSYLDYPPAEASESFTYAPAGPPFHSAFGPPAPAFAAGLAPDAQLTFVYADHPDAGSAALAGGSDSGASPFIGFAAGPNLTALDGSHAVSLPMGDQARHGSTGDVG